jgi:hypothetical protein
MSTLKQRVAALESVDALTKEQLAECLRLLNTLVDRLGGLVVSQFTAINSIVVDGADVLLDQPLFIVIESDGSEVSAKAPEFESTGFGATEVEAITDLKAFLGELYLDLMNSPDETLGRLPLSWKRILEKLVGTHAQA